MAYGMLLAPLRPSATASALGAIARCVGSLLGPQRTLKSQPLLSSDPLSLLHALAAEHPCALILLEACETHLVEHGSGVSTLVCLVGDLARALNSLCDQGFAARAALHALRRAVDLACATLAQLAIPVKLGGPSEHSREFAPDGPTRSAPLPPAPHASVTCEPPEALALDQDVAWFFESDEESQQAQALLRSAAEALALKEKGNRCLREGRAADALNCYSAAIEAYEALVLQAGETERHSRPLAVSLSNRALVLCEMERGEEAAADARRALGIDPTYSKAYHRLGRALQLLGREEEASAAFHGVLPAPKGSALEAPLVSSGPESLPPDLLRLGAAMAHGNHAEMGVALRAAALLGPLPWRLASAVHMVHIVGAQASRSCVFAGLLHPLPLPDHSKLGSLLSPSARVLGAALLDANLDESIFGHTAAGEGTLEGHAALCEQGRSRESSVQRMVNVTAAHLSFSSVLYALPIHAATVATLC